MAAGMSAPLRWFHFEPGWPVSALARAIRAALDDEGLRLVQDEQGGRLVAYRVNGRDRVPVPVAWIVEARR